MKNIDLKSKYNQVYKDGGYENFFSFLPYEESETIIKSIPTWEGKEVLEIGCGEGDLSSLIAYHGAKKVTAIDFSEEAISIAKKRYNLSNVQFHQCDYKEVKTRYDVVVMQGVLEHMDNPLETLKYIKNKLLKMNGYIICSCPNFINPRGYIYMTLKLLFNVPMSLTDIHYLSQADFYEFAGKLGMSLQYRLCEELWANGRKMIIDLKKRIPKALSDIGLQGNTEALIEWLEKNLTYISKLHFSFSNSEGAVSVYTLNR